jgi:hypothetical protein
VILIIHEVLIFDRTFSQSYILYTGFQSKSIHSIIYHHVFVHIHTITTCELCLSILFIKELGSDNLSISQPSVNTTIVQAFSSIST